MVGTPSRGEMIGTVLAGMDVVCWLLLFIGSCSLSKECDLKFCQEGLTRFK